MAMSNDTGILFNFSRQHPLKNDSPQHPLYRFTSKSVRARVLVTPTNEATETNCKAPADASSQDPNVQTPASTITDPVNKDSNWSTTAAQGETTEEKSPKPTSVPTTRPAARSVQTSAISTPARDLKRRLSSITVGGVPTSKGTAEHDPANHEIKRLREERKLKWDQIAEVLNEQLVAQGKSPAFTHNGVYSRYTRNAPRIAAMEAWPRGQDEMLVRAYHEVQAEMASELWERVSAKIVDAGGAKLTPAACALRYGFL